MKGQQYDPNDWEHYWEKKHPGGMTFQQIQGRFQWGACTEGMMWAMTQPSPSVAWQNCKNGRWMRWALNAHMPRLEDFAKDGEIENWFRRNSYSDSGESLYKEETFQEEYANEIRRWYPVWPGDG